MRFIAFVKLLFRVFGPFVAGYAFGYGVCEIIYRLAQ